jgi:hypothetical protein
MKRPIQKDSLIMGSLLFVVAVVLGTVLTIAVEKWELHLDVVANLAVAAGTIGLAYFTWESVRGTKDVIAGEDRRHQIGFAPLLFVDSVSPLPGSAKFAMKIMNNGLGFVQSGNFTVVGEFRTSQFVNGNTALGVMPPKPFKAIGSYALVAVDKTNDVPVSDVPANYNQIVLNEVTLCYFDMFDNSYETYYPDWSHDRGDFRWIPPDNLKPPRPGKTKDA